jgi:phosphoribosylformylglycinamidine synthase subunit PurS
MNFKVEVYVSLKESILDPQGKTVNIALGNLGYNNVSKTRIGKYITFNCEADSKKNAEETVRDIANKVLTNQVMETYTYEIKEI